MQNKYFEIMTVSHEQDEIEAQSQMDRRIGRGRENRALRGLGCSGRSGRMGRTRVSVCVRVGGWSDASQREASTRRGQNKRDKESPVAT